MKHKKNIINAIDSEYYHFNGISKELIRIESLSRIRRYGKDYHNNHIEKSHGLVSNYMRTFLYLKFMEDTLKELRRNG